MISSAIPTTNATEVKAAVELATQNVPTITIIALEIIANNLI